MGRSYVITFLFTACLQHKQKRESQVGVPARTANPYQTTPTYPYPYNYPMVKQNT